jgi:translation initiation factor IF-3
MRIHPKRFRRPVDTGPVYRINEQVTAPEVRVIDENAAYLGVMSSAKALAIAQERGYDLVEVAPKDNPPVCKILNFGQFKYEKEREIRKQKAHAKDVEVKGIRLSPRIAAGDLETRMKTARKFLDDDNKIRVEIILRGREKAHAHLARGVIEGFLAKLKEDYSLVTEQPIQNSNGQLTTIVAKK